jgi:hypothetical protein
MISLARLQTHHALLIGVRMLEVMVVIPFSLQLMDVPVSLSTYGIPNAAC